MITIDWAIFFISALLTFIITDLGRSLYYKRPLVRIDCLLWSFAGSAVGVILNGIYHGS